MLAANVAIHRLLLCLVIAINAVVCLESSDNPVQEGITQDVKVPLVPDPSKVSETSVSSIEPRILDRTTVFKRGKQHSLVNTTLLKKRIEDINEDDTTTTTHFSSPVSPDSSSMKTMEFRPSVHMGEIDDYDSRKSTTNPFNNVQHLNFENSVSIDDHDTGRVRAPLSSSSSLYFHGGERASPIVGSEKNRVKFFETDSRYSIAVPVEYYVTQQMQLEQQHTDEAVHNEDDNNNHIHYNHDHNQLTPMSMGHKNLVTFENPRSHYAEVSARPMTLGRPVYPAMMMDQQMHLQHYQPGTNDVRTIYVKPPKFHSEVEVVTSMPVVRIHHYEYVAPVSNEAMEQPKVLPHQQGSYQVVSQPTESVGIAKPETVLYLSRLRETAFTRMHQFPYKFYHPEGVHDDKKYYSVSEESHSYAQKERSVSPWKKIIHLIGAFIPFGLLLASLKPNVNRMGNATRPNMALPKMRDLPAEHKRSRVENNLDNAQQDMCEDKSICELILNSSESHINLLHNILWDLTNKSNDEEAKKHGLHEIFAAVKQRDCSSINC